MNDPKTYKTKKAVFKNEKTIALSKSVYLNHFEMKNSTNKSNFLQPNFIYNLAKKETENYRNESKKSEKRSQLQIKK